MGRNKDRTGTSPGMTMQRLFSCIWPVAADFGDSAGIYPVNGNVYTAASLRGEKRDRGLSERTGDALLH